MAAEAPFHTPVFVVTSSGASPGSGPGGTTFYFVNDGIRARFARRARWPATGTSASPAAPTTIQQYLNAGLVDEFSLAISPVMFGGGTRLFDHVDASSVALEPTRSEATPRATHLTYAVHQR